MNSKSINVKKFINDVGTKNQLFVFAGSNTSDSLSDSTQSATDIWAQSDFSLKVGLNNLMAVVPYVKWVAKRPFIPWSSNIKNTGSYYAYNDLNGYVYLCISDNMNNRKDHRGDNVSNVRPSHTASIQTYSDGYSWKPLYRITPSINRFASSKWLPVVSFDTFDASTQDTQLNQTRSFCSNATSTIGKCGIFAKIPLSTDDDSGTIEYQNGDLFTVANDITCSDCYYLMKDNEKFTTVFYTTSQTIPSNITIANNYELVGQLIQNNELNTSSPYYYLYQINENDDILEGSIISTFIDLSSFTTKQLICNKENPEVTIKSGSGFGGKIILKTGILNDEYVLEGIEIISRGSGYKDISISIDSNLFSNIDSALIAAKIEINLDTIDGIGFDPATILDTQHVMIDARLEKSSIESAGIVLPNTLNFFGLLQNPIEVTGSNQIIAGSNLNKKIDTIFRTTVQVKLVNPSGQFPDSGEIFDDVVEVPVEPSPSPGSLTSNILSPTIKIGGIKELDATSAAAEIKGINYNISSDLVGKTLPSSNGTLTITEILDKPIFSQYSGTILTTSKQNLDLTISDVDSVIIRINMVQGM